MVKRNSKIFKYGMSMALASWFSLEETPI